MVKKDKPESNIQDFEKTFEELEKLVEKLENGELSLSEGISKFEEGVGLYKNCKSMLQFAEKKVSILTDKLKEEKF